MIVSRLRVTLRSVRIAGAAASSVGLFAGTLALLLLVPSAGFWLAIALPLAVVALAFGRGDWLPWLLVPTLAALSLWASAHRVPTSSRRPEASSAGAFWESSSSIKEAGFISSVGFAYQADGLPPRRDGDSFRYWRRGWYIWTGGST
jgi:hypothetical protein